MQVDQSFVEVAKLMIAVLRLLDNIKDLACPGDLSEMSILFTHENRGLVHETDVHHGSSSIQTISHKDAMLVENRIVQLESAQYGR